MRKTTVKVKYQVPQGTELTKLVKKSAISYIYIGTPMNAAGAVSGDSLCVQLNDKIVGLKDVKGYLSKERLAMSAADKKQMSVSVACRQSHTDGHNKRLKAKFARNQCAESKTFAATFKKQQTSM